MPSQTASPKPSWRAMSEPRVQRVTIISCGDRVAVPQHVGDHRHAPASGAPARGLVEHEAQRRRQAGVDRLAGVLEGEVVGGIELVQTARRCCCSRDP